MTTSFFLDVVADVVLVAAHCRGWNHSAFFATLLHSFGIHYGLIFDTFYDIIRSYGS